jgi:hypothetical protein
MKSECCVRQFLVKQFKLTLVYNFLLKLHTSTRQQVHYFLIFIFFRYDTEWWRDSELICRLNSPDLICFLFLHEYDYLLATFNLKYFTSAIFLKDFLAVFIIRISSAVWRSAMNVLLGVSLCWNLIWPLLFSLCYSDMLWSFSMLEFDRPLLSSLCFFCCIHWINIFTVFRLITIHSGWKFARNKAQGHRCKHINIKFCFKKTKFIM